MKGLSTTWADSEPEHHTDKGCNDRPRQYHGDYRRTIEVMIEPFTTDQEDYGCKVECQVCCD